MYSDRHAGHDLAAQLVRPTGFSRRTFVERSSSARNSRARVGRGPQTHRKNNAHTRRTRHAHARPRVGHATRARRTRDTRARQRVGHATRAPARQTRHAPARTHLKCHARARRVRHARAFDRGISTRAMEKRRTTHTLARLTHIAKSQHDTLHGVAAMSPSRQNTWTHAGLNSRPCGECARPLPVG